MKHTRTKVTDNVSILRLEDGTEIRIWTHRGQGFKARVLDIRVNGVPFTEVKVSTAQRGEQ